jgi:hypothetical protein
MGTRAGTLSLCLVIVAVAFASACDHLTKLPVAEVPIDQFEGTPPPTPAGAPTTVPVVEADAPPLPPPAPSTNATTSAATTKAAGASSGGPVPIEPPDPAEDKIQAAKKLMARGTKPDLLQARKILVADVGSGNGTPGEARVLRQVCVKLNDKPCIAKATTYIK